jgi:hypothetical protein
MKTSIRREREREKEHVSTLSFRRVTNRQLQSSGCLQTIGLTITTASYDKKKCHALKNENLHKGRERERETEKFCLFLFSFFFFLFSFLKKKLTRSGMKSQPHEIAIHSLEVTGSESNLTLTRSLCHNWPTGPAQAENR